MPVPSVKTFASKFPLRSFLSNHAIYMPLFSSFCNLLLTLDFFPPLVKVMELLPHAPI